MRRVKTPTLLQMEALECGAAALGIILGYYGKFVPLEKLRIACGVSRDGSKAINMLKAARNYGMEAQGAKADLASLKTVDAPFIVFWQFNHFIVVEGFAKDKVYINDPATGPRTISASEFDKGFTGVLLILRPGPSFEKGGRPPGLLGPLKRRLKSNYSAVVFITLISLFLIIPGVVIPGFSKIFIDDILIREMQGWFGPLVIGMLLVGVLQTLLVYLQNRFLLRLQMKMLLSMSSQFVWHLLHLPIQFFYQRFAGDILDRINANDRIASLLSSEITGSVVSLFSMVFFVLILFAISWPLTLVALLFSFANLSLFYFVSKKIADMSRNFLQQSGRLRGYEMAGLNSIETIKASASEDDFFKHWTGFHANIINIQQSMAAYSQLLLIIPKTLNGLSSVIILILGSYLIMQGQLTVGTLVAFQALLVNFNQPILNLLGVGQSLQQIRGDIMRVDDIYNYPEQETHETQTVKDIEGSVNIRELTFGYSILEPPLIKGINLKVKDGQKIAIIGKTGCGKSTLVKLMAGLFQPWSGEIRISGVPIEQMTAEQRAKTLAYVDQDIFLFEGSLRENLTLWDKSIPDSDLLDAMQYTKLDEFLTGRGGLETYIEERGKNLSGGQKQRIEVTRSLVKKPSILILDEATANLDMPLEKELIDRLKRSGITLIVITHRIEAIKDFDHIVVLEKGQILEEGTHNQLLSKNGFYKTLYKL